MCDTERREALHPTPQHAGELESHYRHLQALHHKTDNRDTASHTRCTFWNIAGGLHAVLNWAGEHSLLVTGIVLYAALATAEGSWGSSIVAPASIRDQARYIASFCPTAATAEAGVRYVKAFLDQANWWTVCGWRLGLWRWPELAQACQEGSFLARLKTE